MNWISVKDKLPEENVWVLVLDNNEFQVASYRPQRASSRYNIDDWSYSLCPCCDSGPDMGNITHWMPLPEKPKD